MLKLHSSHTKLDTLFLVSLFVLFAFTAGILVLLGAGQYRDTVRTMDHNYEVRTTTSYLSEKLHQHDSSSVNVAEFCGIPALAFPETVDNSSYVTYIYYYDHSLRELFVQTDASCTPSMGQEIVPLKSFRPEIADNGLIIIQFTDSDGEKHTQHLYSHLADAKEES